jgi:diguanylate cyclase (GGDEF)-like protein/PAS domain S-box-containing protein
MTIYRSIHLRLWLPLIILAGLLLLVGLLSLSRYHYQNQRMETYLEGQLRHELNRDQRLIEGLLRIREYGLVAEEIAELGSAPEVSYAMLVDDTGRVSFASERLWQGRLLSDVLPEQELPLVEAARQEYRLTLTFNRVRNAVHVYQAVRLAEDTGEIRSHRNGVLVLEYDLSNVQLRLQRIVLQDLWTSLGIGAIIILLLFLLLHRYLVRPLNYLNQLVNRISQGHFDTDIRLLGEGELAHLGHSIGHMQAQLMRMYNEQAQAREELTQFKNTLDQTLDGVIIASTDGFRFLYVNQGIQRQLGYSEAELLTMTPLDIKPDGDAAQLSERMEPLLLGQVASLSFESLHQHKDGHVFPVEIFLQLIHQNGNSSRFVAIVRDISVRKYTEALLNNQMAVLEMIAQGEPLERVLTELITAVEAQAPEMLCSVLLLDADGGHLHDCVAPRLPETYRRAIDGSAIGPDAGSCGTAAFRGEPVIVSDIASDPLWVNYADLALAHDLRACWSTPIFSATHTVLGTFAVYYRVPTEPDSAHQKYIAMATHTAAIAIERQRAEAALRDSVEYTHIIFDNVADGIITIDAQGLVESYNNSAALMFGYTAEEIIGKNISQLMPEPYRSQHDTYLENYHQGAAPRVIGKGREMDAQRKDGQVFPVYLSVSRIVHHGQEKFIGLLSDISDRRRNEEKIQRLAFYDPLTELPNRRLLIDRLQHALVACSRNGKLGALLLLDLDNFKDLNDTLGHDAGDQLLCQVAQRLVTCVREGDTVARLGGDEFVVVLENLNVDIQEAAATAQKTGEMVLAVLRQSYQLGPSEYFSSPSIGITLFSQQQETVDTLLKRADVAMYQAKSAGRNTLQFFDSALQASLEARTVLEADMRLGLHQQQFFLYYQPQVDGAGHVFGAEALLRWQHPVRGMVSPAEFIPLAEQSGFILQLGHWVLHTACAQLVAWASNPLTAELSLAINVSARQFRQIGFVEQVMAVVRETGARPQRIKLELTESLLVSNIDDVIEKMRALKTYGVGFSLDDFGTGYSSLSYLRQLPLDQLKIDQTFVRDVLIDQNDAVIAQTIIGLGVSLGLEVIAEGVEVEGQREFMAAHGCHAYQGYLFSRPVPVAEFEAFLRRTAGLD